MAAKQTPEQKLVTAACKAIEEHGWTGLNLAQVAKKAKLPLATVYDICPTKSALLPLIGKDVDLKFLEHAPEIDAGMHPRDRAFDAILSWFEQLQPLKPVFAAIRNDSRGDLSLIVDLVPMAMRSAHWIASAAHLPDVQSHDCTKALLCHAVFAHGIGNGQFKRDTRRQYDKLLTAFGFGRNWECFSALHIRR